MVLHSEAKSDLMRFTFIPADNPAQVLFDDKDLDLPTGLTIELLQALVNNFDKIVVYGSVDINSNRGTASEQIREAKRNIVKAFSKSKVPYIIKSKTNKGYLITSKTSHS